MNTLTLDEVVIISLAIKIIVGAVFSILENITSKRFEKLEKPLLVIFLFIITITIKHIHGIDYKSALNIFFYTLGIDNIAEYSKKSIYDIKDKMNNSGNKNDSK